MYQQSNSAMQVPTVPQHLPAHTHHVPSRHGALHVWKASSNCTAASSPRGGDKLVHFACCCPQGFKRLSKLVAQNSTLAALLRKPESRQLLTPQGRSAAAARPFSEEQVCFVWLQNTECRTRDHALASVQAVDNVNKLQQRVILFWALKKSEMFSKGMRSRCK